MTFTNRIGEDIYIKLNSDDEPKVLHAYDSRVSFVFQPSGRDDLQVSCLMLQNLLLFLVSLLKSIICKTEKTFFG